MSSGITCPFGQLSQSPGYISDSLLTRSPLGLAAPCDLHVLATPPAFRLSQDQTLQLNFLDTRSLLRPTVTSHAASCMGVYVRLMLSRRVVVRETSLLQAERIKTYLRSAVTACSSARTGR